MITFKKFLDESINDKGIFKAVFIVGIPGAGKSYTLKQLTGSISPRVVNTDRATEYLAKTYGKPVDSSNWLDYKDTAHRITSGALFNYLNGVLPIFVDGTSNDASNILHRSGLLESLGYDIGMVFIDTPIEVALKRAAARERKVDPDFIKAVNDQSAENKKFFQSKFNFFREIKNGDGELTDEVMLQAFKKVSGFFGEPVANPVGKRFLEKMRDSKAKYLIPDMMSKEVLSKKIEGWYKS